MDTYFKISDQWEICRSIYFLDEDYYSLPSKKQKEKKQDYIDKLSSWLDQIYQD